LTLNIGGLSIASWNSQFRHSCASLSFRTVRDPLSFATVASLTAMSLRLALGFSEKTADNVGGRVLTNDAQARLNPPAAYRQAGRVVECEGPTTSNGLASVTPGHRPEVRVPHGRLGSAGGWRDCDGGVRGLRREAGQNAVVQLRSSASPGWCHRRRPGGWHGSRPRRPGLLSGATGQTRAAVRSRRRLRSPRSPLTPVQRHADTSGLIMFIRHWRSTWSFSTTSTRVMRGPSTKRFF
jgi:hypothetical protein